MAPSRWRRPRISRWSRHSRRAVLTQRSAKAFAFGARIGVLITRTPSVRNTSSKEPENFESRSRSTNRTPRSPLPHREVAGLLGDPDRVRVPGDAEHMDAA